MGDVLGVRNPGEGFAGVAFQAVRRCVGVPWARTDVIEHPRVPAHEEFTAHTVPQQCLWNPRGPWLVKY